MLESSIWWAYPLGWLPCPGPGEAPGKPFQGGGYPTPGSAQFSPSPAFWLAPWEIEGSPRLYGDGRCTGHVVRFLLC